MQDRLIFGIPHHLSAALIRLQIKIGVTLILVEGGPTAVGLHLTERVVRNWQVQTVQQILPIVGTAHPMVVVNHHQRQLIRLRGQLQHSPIAVDRPQNDGIALNQRKSRVALKLLQQRRGPVQKPTQQQDIATQQPLIQITGNRPINPVVGGNRILIGDQQQATRCHRRT
ncbi:hypothetical protein L0Z66_12780 [Phaeobacter sp. BS34]